MPPPSSFPSSAWFTMTTESGADTEAKQPQENNEAEKGKSKSSEPAPPQNQPVQLPAAAGHSTPARKQQVRFVIVTSSHALFTVLVQRTAGEEIPFTLAWELEQILTEFWVFNKFEWIAVGWIKAGVYGRVQSSLVTYVLKSIALAPVSVPHLGFDTLFFFFAYFCQSQITLKLKERTLQCFLK